MQPSLRSLLCLACMSCVIEGVALAAETPRLLSVRSSSSTEIQLTFSQELAISQAEAMTAFHVTSFSGNELAIGIIKPVGRRVVLVMTSPMEQGTFYTITVSVGGSTQSMSFLAAERSQTPLSPAPSNASPSPPTHAAAPITRSLPSAGLGIVTILVASGAVTGWMQSKKKKEM
jgi:hypothetical protein